VPSPGKHYKQKPQGTATGGQKNTAIKNTSYETYDIGKILLPGEHYRRKPQNTATGKYKKNTATEKTL